ncbi:hypothetical protein VB005_07147 [Metarhizium brunneum]
MEPLVRLTTVFPANDGTLSRVFVDGVVVEHADHDRPSTAADGNLGVLFQFGSEFHDFVDLETVPFSVQDSRRMAGLVQCLRESIAHVADADESDMLGSHLSSSVILIAIVVDFVVWTLLFILQYKSRRKPACASSPSTVPPKNTFASEWAETLDERFTILLTASSCS